MSSPEASNRQARTGESSARLWVLLDARRSAIVAMMAVAIFLALVLLSTLDPSPLAESSGDPIDTAFQGLIGAVITGVSLVVSITQLSLSQELGPVGGQRDRMDSSLGLQDDIESAAGEIESPDPSTYLRLLCVASRKQASALQSAVAESDDELLGERVDRFASRVVENAEGIETELADARFGDFAVIRAALNYNYSWKIYAARRLRIEHTDSIDEQASEAFEDIVDTLSLFGPAREYFKTQYVQWELVNLSRTIIYAAIPALVVSIATVFYVDETALSGMTFGISNLTWVASASATIAVLPFLVLVAYMLRLATISKRTGTTGPFILREAERLDVFDW
ncbi:hypothetical protein BRC86_04020 [Halobacteriales archaeon QS_3_64_16]|nr:MAG: hypothetical protein BRC86_04020 [Halobacteriales archaeon QS_3_64_16]